MHLFLGRTAYLLLIVTFFNDHFQNICKFNTFSMFFHRHFASAYWNFGLKSITKVWYIFWHLRVLGYTLHYITDLKIWTVILPVYQKSFSHSRTRQNIKTHTLPPLPYHLRPLHVISPRWHYVPDDPLTSRLLVSAALTVLRAEWRLGTLPSSWSR